MSVISATKPLLAGEPPDLGPGPRPGVQSQPALDTAITNILRGHALPDANGPLVRALVLLWHDHLDAAHRLAQAVENPDGSFVHGIMHRREPDYSNAKYWFHRTGNHGCFGELAQRTAAVCQQHGQLRLLEMISPRGHWDPFAFIDACESAAQRSGGEALTNCLREVQQQEFEVLLDYLCRES